MNDNINNNIELNNVNSNSNTDITSSNGTERKYRIAMISDFFYPNMGGVEEHLYQLSQCLIKRGNKVIIITHNYGNRFGVRYVTNGLKVYYIPQAPFYNQSSFPTLYFTFPLFRQILLRERIDIVHCHQAFSTLAHESILHARTMGYNTCFTDHSLFGFADASSIHMNKLLKFSLSDISHVICVSNTSKENTVLRAQLDPHLVSVIPNAVDTTQFTPDPSKRDPNKSTILKSLDFTSTSINTLTYQSLNNHIVTIVIMSRLVYRKGIDLIIDIIPNICKKFPNAHFVIGGDGPKRVSLEEMREKHQLHDRVELLGSVKHSNVRNVLVRGDVFLNSSLTEAFCIAIVEAASCGLYVVSTKVGGVPEVLPPHMISLAQPKSEDLEEKLTNAILQLKHTPLETHEEVKSMYDWNDVAKRTEAVYEVISKAPKVPFIERLRRFVGCGLWAGKLNCMVVALDNLLWRWLEWYMPREDIDEAFDYPYQAE
ncbi:GlcNAc transferase [Heterostelium album PN500]|uniref:phosphatidylinositol N-acetylglucosaminyltransferase n=1 Tax=Heterostelium pallidum (strain ATCC 26659 / Pp 5 / PN500) TaxID=670386 RepID=D3BF15_HETP5|nr:GlcNAc transferase [Heterostelium album PN500]EFA80496.1 GlcNAc transferase [Heterostelium album PN500]|eukprot:XP_020432616.1 GlcNAc transferase [Heterostelium album PN500]